MPPAGQWVPPTLLAWLVPGGGHFLLKRKGRAAVLFAAIVVLFLFGLMQRGSLFEPKSGTTLEMVINTAGFLANLAAGLPYLLAKGLGYVGPDIPGHVHDYGTKFLVIAGLLNLLAIVDAFDIAVGKKD